MEAANPCIECKAPLQDAEERGEPGDDYCQVVRVRSEERLGHQRLQPAEKEVGDDDE